MSAKDFPKMYNKYNRAFFFSFPIFPSLISNALHVAAFVLLMSLGVLSGFAQRGASVPWTTYEAENMTISGGTILGPGYAPNTVQAESSQRECVKLAATGQYVQFTAQAAANALIVRYSVPDTAGGGGTNYTLSLYTNGVLAEELPVTSMYSWLYGAYPFTNTPSAGSPRNFYDEARTIGLVINPGEVIRLQVGPNDKAAFYDLDLVDLENVAAPLTQPANSLSITNAPYDADPTGTNDSTAALTSCISAAHSAGKSVWLPPGNFLISGTITLPSNITVQGAGMWYTTLVGNPAVYNNPATTYGSSNRRISFLGNGSNIHLSDFAVVGKLNYRNDSDYNDGIVGPFGTGSTISRLWVEHTKVGAWIWNSQGLVINGCRFRDTIADGCNVNYGMQSTLVTNCTTRGTGDDCFAFWPANSTETYNPASNVVTHCTGELNFLANGGALYGGEANTIEDCLFQDITYGCGVLVSSTFAVGTNVFSGTTVAQRCDLIRDGGYDLNFAAWRGAVQICLQLTSITNLNLNNLNLSNSASDGFEIISPGTGVSLGNAIMANVDVLNYGLNGDSGSGSSGNYGLYAESPSAGSLTVSNCTVNGVWATALNTPAIVDGSGSFTFNFGISSPPPPYITSETINGNGSVTLAYATTAPYPYYVEGSTNLLLSGAWKPIIGSTNSATGTSLTFTDTNPLGNQLFFRTVSP